MVIIKARHFILAILVLLVIFLIGCQSQTEIRTSQIEEIVKNADSGAFLSSVKFENNMLIVEYKSSYSTSSIVTKDLYEVVKDTIQYVSSLGLTSDIKITVMDINNEHRKTSTLSWSEVQRLINLEMSYDEWEKGLTSG